MNKKEALAILPSEPLSSQINPANLVIMIIAPPKWGKTNFFMSNPNCLLLGFEEGHKFQRGLKITIDKWDYKGKYPITEDADGVMHMTAMQALEAIQLAKGRYEMVAIDTVDMMAKMAADYFTEKEGKEHISELGDYGKGFDKGQNNPVRKFIVGILKTGCGVGLITHAKVTTSKFGGSGEVSRNESTLSKGVKSICETQADIIMFGEYGKKQPGERLRDRVLVCEGDMDTLAGNRSGGMLPERYVVDKKGPWKQFRRFFKDPAAADAAEKEYRRRIRSTLKSA